VVSGFEFDNEKARPTSRCVPRFGAGQKLFDACGVGR
jgi:hypothetical protein